MTFNNKTVIVTGGGSGIGLEVAKRFVDAGANVVINGRDEAKLVAAAAAIDASGERVAFIAADVAKPETAKAVVQKAIDAFGGVDILVNNAGVFEPKPFLELTEGDYDRFLDIILKGKFFMAQEAAKAMQRRGGGAIATHDQ